MISSSAVPRAVGVFTVIHKTLSDVVAIKETVSDWPVDSITSPHWDLSRVVAELHAARNRWRISHQRSREFGGREFPSREALHIIINDLRGVLFPRRLGPPDLYVDRIGLENMRVMNMTSWYTPHADYNVCLGCV